MAHEGVFGPFVTVGLVFVVVIVVVVVAVVVVSAVVVVISSVVVVVVLSAVVEETDTSRGIELSSTCGVCPQAVRQLIQRNNIDTSIPAFFIITHPPSLVGFPSIYTESQTASLQHHEKIHRMHKKRLTFLVTVLFLLLFLLLPSLSTKGPLDNHKNNGIIYGLNYKERCARSSKNSER